VHVEGDCRHHHVAGRVRGPAERRFPTRGRRRRRTPGPGDGAGPGRYRDPRTGDCGDWCGGDGSAAVRCRRRAPMCGPTTWPTALNRRGRFRLRGHPFGAAERPCARQRRHVGASGRRVWGPAGASGSIPAMVSQRMPHRVRGDQRGSLNWWAARVASGRCRGIAGRPCSRSFTVWVRWMATPPPVSVSSRVRSRTVISFSADGTSPIVVTIGVVGARRWSTGDRGRVRRRAVLICTRCQPIGGVNRRSLEYVPSMYQHHGKQRGVEGNSGKLEMKPEQAKSLLPGAQQSSGRVLITRRSQVQILPPPTLPRQHCPANTAPPPI
jgi:hypothetical protein